MPKLRHYWLLETAKAFGLNVDEFANNIGYSRQAIYQAASGENKLDRGRLAMAIFKLEVQNERQLENEKKKAIENYEYRKKLIDSLMERLSG